MTFRLRLVEIILDSRHHDGVFFVYSKSTRKGGKTMAIKLTSAQSRKVNRLVKSYCCNYCDGSCLLLDDGDAHDCVQVNSFSSIMCNYFVRCVLPNDAQLEAEIMQPQNCKSCACCGAAYVPASNRQKYCSSCAEAQTRRRKAEQKRRKRAMQRRHLGA